MVKKLRSTRTHSSVERQEAIGGLELSNEHRAAASHQDLVLYLTFQMTPKKLRFQSLFLA
jgi:hypothetical protein